MRVRFVRGGEGRCASGLYRRAERGISDLFRGISGLFRGIGGCLGARRRAAASGGRAARARAPRPARPACGGEFVKRRQFVKRRREVTCHAGMPPSPQASRLLAAPCPPGSRRASPAEPRTDIPRPGRTAAEGANGRGMSRGAEAGLRGAEGGAPSVGVYGRDMGRGNSREGGEVSVQ